MDRSSRTAFRPCGAAARPRLVTALLLAGAVAMLGGCGGGNGLGPTAIKQQEDKVADRLTLDWEAYNQRDYAASIERFTQTLTEAERLEGSEGVRNRIRSEGYNGIGWTQFRMQNLQAAWDAFRRATSLDRQNTDAWVGWAGVALAMARHSDVVQYCIQVLEEAADYSSAARTDNAQRELGHDGVDERHVRLMLAEAYFHLGRYSVEERDDPFNAAAQVRLIDSGYRYHDPGQLVQAMSEIALDLHGAAGGGF